MVETMEALWAVDWEVKMVEMMDDWLAVQLANELAGWKVLTTAVQKVVR
jgi:hypothetical protein